ncbi:BaiN/RdsA family NAD(P)/FAD-dependent oxidoreductase [Paenibacillus gallinarum]|uniref:NAD(P)/FAD-dependent oxidoreductase n=1 Tax=Paenibacillus gallinarum TaxID=2762232 RepID=A0ABR8SZC2_9BACL|nr:NAD(P)/FAD-dependent oxidoreductase [Paenibacillus gallinarum]MBD7968843.1 NAD(P)/FAD-dependent oxidoreductase [Paenibacillus gallinarum]
MNVNVIVIGGGPSGLMASVAAAEHGASVLLIDKGNKLGRKLGISGGGRCNVTNAKEPDELIRHIPGNGKFLYSAFQHLDNRGIMRFFEDLGIALKEEDNGRMFPVSDRAKTVVDALIGKATALGVKIYTDSPVSEIVYEDQKVAGVKLTSGKMIHSDAVIVATGGKSVPQTGSTGDGYPWAEAAGHTITELYPTEVPIVSGERFIQSKELQGLSLSDIALFVHDAKDKVVIRHEGDMIFTHFGLSGPVALRCSQFIRKVQKKTGSHQVTMKLDLYPSKSLGEMTQELKYKLEQEPKKAIKNSLKGIVPERLIPVLLTKAEIEEDTTYHHLPKGAIETLANLIKGFPIVVTGTRSLAEAFVTGGGVNLKEIYPKTMESKLMQGLYFCGEILDIHGYTGGYNITAAFSTGYTAGKHAAEQTTGA